MLMRDLARLLRPRSVAVIGGGAVARFVVANCGKIGFAGDLWQVHPERGPFRRIAELPAAPDAAFVGVNRAASVEIVGQLAAMGAGGAVVYASGFREADAETGDGADMQARLVGAAGAMPLIGPNCYGFLNYLDGAALWPDQQGGRRVDRGVAILTQSSNIAINLTMQRRGLPIAYVVTAGNQAQTGLAEIAAALIEDRRVTALGLHVEGVGDIAALERLAARARALAKPVVALKVGASDRSRAAAVSHTASLAGSEAGARALFDRLGIGRVGSLQALLETLKLLHVIGPLPHPQIAAMSCSGGEASLVADAAMGRALEFPDLDETQRNGLAEALGPRVALANPLDYHTYVWGDTARMTGAFAAMMRGAPALGLVIADFPRADRCSDADWEPVIAAVAGAAEAAGKPMAIAASLPETMPEATAERLIGRGIVPLNGLEPALDAVETAAWLGRARDPAAPVWPPEAPADPRLLTEAGAKDALAAHGVPVPAGMRCDGPAALEAAARALRFPLVLKAEGLAHKTETGGVALGIADVAGLRAAAQAMGGAGWLVEEMVAGAVAELLVGVVVDPAHGYVLTLAAGGTLTEIIADSTSLLLPVTGAEIRAALGRLGTAALLRGYRGRPAAGTEAIVAAVLAVQDYVGHHRGRIAEVEINPLICTPDRAVAADALIRIGGPG